MSEYLKMSKEELAEEFQSGSPRIRALEGFASVP